MHSVPCAEERQDAYGRMPAERQREVEVSPPHTPDGPLHQHVVRGLVLVVDVHAGRVHRVRHGAWLRKLARRPHSAPALCQVVQREYVRRDGLPRLPGHRRLPTTTIATRPTAVADTTTHAARPAATTMHTGPGRAHVHGIEVLRGSSAHMLQEARQAWQPLWLRGIHDHVPHGRHVGLRGPLQSLAQPALAAT